MRPQTLIILNNLAARARRAWPKIKDQLDSAGVRFEVHETVAPGDATTAARLAIARGFRTLAVVGGDGTINETAEGFFDLKNLKDGLPSPTDPEAVLAILPAGTGDDFARGLINERASTETWTRRLIEFLKHPHPDQTKRLDVVFGRIDGNPRGFIFVNVATLGIGPEVVATVSTQAGIVRRMSGEARFIAAACKALTVWRERNLLITIDDGPPIVCSSNLVAVANSVFAGGGMKFAPAAKTDDGMLDLLIAADLSRIGIARELPRIRNGGHLANPKVKTFTGKRVRIENKSNNDPLLIEADGNLRGHTPVEFTVLPAALRVVL
jgi:YegS/Rv2252/BmrU family lipid kinase